MSEEDDFDIVPDDEVVGGSRSTWLWVSIIAVVALFAFGVGAAFMILSDRMGTGSPTATPDLSVIAPPPVALITATLTLTPNGTITVTGTPTGTPTVTVTPSPTATPFCTQPVEDLFVPLYSQAQFGCATNSAAIVWAAYQPFERGSMLWRSDRDTSYVFYTNGSWFPIEQGWDGGPMADRGAPPPGLQAPQRGFGWVWSHSDEIFNGLGWAGDQEKGFCALVQEFERGFILRSANVASCTPENLYNFAAAGDWTPLLLAAADSGQWRNVPSAELPAQQGGERPAAGITRPAPQGIFDARNASAVTLDGNFNDWPDAWVPINALIVGADRHTGPGDLSANFQVGWNANGLMLAVRVNDDLYRPGPIGSNLWQGDSLELQFDRQLAEDFNSTQADADDYQVGIAFDNNLTAIRGYLWLPFEREAELALPGSVVAVERGYQVEVLIPWYVFDLPGAPSTDRAYGFNLSVNDNDSDSFAQEVVLSASPARTTHDNPTEWGTLRLLP
ncbi:MAG: hypothetical protein IT328_16575 [Caldilineaceae bacterium]|nr:hypothetical protein [Caldilineaceae bacterium]